MSMYSKKQQLALEAVKELKQFPREVEAALEHLAAREEQLSSREFVELLQALLKAPDVDDADDDQMVFAGVIYR